MGSDGQLSAWVDERSAHLGLLRDGLVAPSPASGALRAQPNFALPVLRARLCGRYEPGPVGRASRVAQVSASSNRTDLDRSVPAVRRWVDEAVRKVEADANRSADTHLIVFELPPDWGVDLYLKDESTHPTGSLKHRLARSAVPLRVVQRLDRPGHHGDRGLVRIDRDLRGLLRADARVAVRGGHAADDQYREDRADRGRRRAVPPGRPTRPRSMPRQPGWPTNRAGTIWTSSPTPNGPLTGAVTTTSPSRSSRSSAPSGIRCRAGSSPARARAARVRPSVVSSATGGCLPGLCVVDPENSAFFDGWADDAPRDGVGGWLTDRRDRPAAGRAKFRRRRGGSDDSRTGRGVSSRDPTPAGRDRTPRRRIDRHEPMGSVAAGRRDAGGGGGRQHRHAVVRPR